MPRPDYLRTAIVNYLDGKAARIRQTSKTDPAPYATSIELAEQLHARLDSVCKSLNYLMKNGRVKMYPKRDERKRNRKYGSLALPELTYGELVLEARISLGQISMKGRPSLASIPLVAIGK
ncbi:MAG: hypothetical protein M1587_03895 [Thaumarchaeota archaeon]|nr:hypothetical protein [Nitrososphaerota archaeon]